MGATTPLSANESVVFKPDRETSSVPDLRILHFNDVYHLDPSSAEPAGGAARFQTAVNGYRSEKRSAEGQPELITLFSGDAFNPSLESSVTKGSHMVPILNALGTAAKCTFPWLMANILDPALGDDVPIGHAQSTLMLTASNGIKIGLLGLGEREWLETVNSLPPNIVYKSATETAKQLIPQLRQDGADMIVILSHAREPNDNKLAQNLDGAADLILGGHDHYYSHSVINGTHVLRSGSDFKQLSYLEAWRTSGPGKGTTAKWDFAIRRQDIVSSIPQYKPTLALVDELTAKLKQSLDKAIGWTAVPLDARFTTVRMKESNLGNFVCDIMRHHYQADCVIMASGTIRGDQVYPPGPLRIKDITDCFPFEDPVVVVRVTGKAILEALENGVALYPALEGRFPQVSNIKFAFDPSRPRGSRITDCEIKGSPVDLEKQYVLCTRGYMVRGKDGYTSLLVKSEGGDAEEIIDEENGILISMMLRQYFMALKVLDRWKHWSAPMDHHWDRVVSSIDASHPHVQAASPSSPRGTPQQRDERSGWDAWAGGRLRQRRSSGVPFDERVIQGATPAPNTAEVEQIDRQMQIMRRVVRKWCRLAGVTSSQGDALDKEEYTEHWTKAIAPRLEDRIKISDRTVA